MPDIATRFQNYKKEKEPEQKEQEEVPDAVIDRYQLYKRKKQGETFLEQTPESTWLEEVSEPIKRIWGEIVKPFYKTGFDLDPNTRVAKDQNAYAEANKQATLAVNKELLKQAHQLSNEHDVPVKDIWAKMQDDRKKMIADTTLKIQPSIRKNWDDYIQEEYGMLTRDKVNQRALQLALTATIGGRVVGGVLEGIRTAGALTTAIKLGTTVGIYSAIKPILGKTLYPALESMMRDKKFSEATAKNPSDLLPEEATDLTKISVDMIEMLGLFAISSKMSGKITPKIESGVRKGFEKITKDVFTRFKLPRKMYISANKVKDVFRTGKKISSEEIDMLKSAELSTKQWRIALQRGAKIEIPSEKVTTLVDKPYWQKIKGFFGVKPYKEIRVWKGDVRVSTPTIAIPKMDKTIKIPPVKGKEPTPKTKQPLIEEAKVGEARKAIAEGKSFEEFVRSQKGIIEKKSDVTGKEQNVIRISKKKGEKLFSELGFEQQPNKRFWKKEEIYAHYNTIDKTWHITGEIPEIKTKPQLTNIWKQTQGEKEVRGKIQEDRTFMHSGVEFTPPLEPNALKKGFQKFKKALDIESPYKAQNAPKVGRRVKENYSYMQAHHYRLEEALKPLGKEKYSGEELSRISFLATSKKKFRDLPKEEKERLGKGVEVARKVLNYYKDKMNTDFYRNISERMKKDNTILGDKLRVAKTESYQNWYRQTFPDKSVEEYIEGVKDQIKTNKKLLKYIKKMELEFVPIARFWFSDNYFQMSPSKRKKILNNYFHRRKTIDWEGLANHLLEEGLIEPEDTQIQKILADYVGRAAKISAIDRVVKAGIEDGVIQPDVPEGGDENMWVSPPTSLRGTLKGLKIYKPVSDLLEYHLAQIPKSMKLSRLFGYTKGLRFYKPQWLAMNDMLQGLTLGSTLPQNVFNFDRWKRAIDSVVNKDEFFFSGMEYGAYSQPYVLPFDEWIKDIDRIAQGKSLQLTMANGVKANVDDVTKDLITRVKRVGNALAEKKLLGTKELIDEIYRPIWNMSWFGDRLIRTFSLHYLVDGGMPMEEAAELVALAHGDYASLPPSARRKLNKIFFVPTFPIVMGKYHYKMLSTSMKLLTEAGIDTVKGKPKRKWSKAEKNLLRGLVVWLGWQMFKHTVMDKLGFKKETYSYRYSKKYKDEKGVEREVVLTLPDPHNTELRNIKRLTSWITDDNQWEELVRRNRWSLHPLWANAIAQLTNDAGGGHNVYDKDDDLDKQYIDRVLYSAKDIIGILKPFAPTASGEDRMKAYEIIEKGLVEDFGKWASFLDNILAFYSFAYTREQPKERIKAYRIKDEIGDFKRRLKNAQEDGVSKEIIAERTENFRKRIKKMVEELEKMRNR